MTQLTLGSCAGCETLSDELNRLRAENARLRATQADMAAAHVAGSASSLAGAEKARGTSAAKRATLLALFDETRPTWTCAELEAATGFLHQSCSARVRELVQAELLVADGKRVNPSSGVKVNVYRLADI